MIVSDSINEVRRLRKREAGLSWGLVPTMGYLHEGHLSLVRRASRENERVAVSIYVNPTQFAPDEDLESYPRDLEKDLGMLREAGVDLVFTPSDKTMYLPGFQTYVLVTGITELLEGASRPTHFRGVTTIVAKLFNIFQPQRAYFGQKDAQQSIVIRQMVEDLNFDVQLVICPIAREDDGLALSSRNRYLTADQRASATVLNRALRAAQAAYAAGQRDGESLRQLMREIIVAEPLARLDYVSVSDPRTLAELETVGEEALLSMAVFFGKTRLIDNVLVGDA